jgi:hypothetical protein
MSPHYNFLHMGALYPPQITPQPLELVKREAANFVGWSQSSDGECMYTSLNFKFCLYLISQFCQGNHLLAILVTRFQSRSLSDQQARDTPIARRREAQYQPGAPLVLLVILLLHTHGETKSGASYRAVFSLFPEGHAKFYCTVTADIHA